MVLMEFSMTPLGHGVSVSEYVARSLRIIRASGLPFQLNAMGTIVEGELEQLLPLLEKCFAAMADDCERISCSVKFDYRKGASGRLVSKVRSVESKLGEDLSSLK